MFLLKNSLALFHMPDLMNILLAYRFRTRVLVEEKETMPVVVGANFSPGLARKKEKEIEKRRQNQNVLYEWNER